MLDLVELATKIVLEHGSEKKSSETIIQEIKSVYADLKAMKNGNGNIMTVAASGSQPEPKSVRTIPVTSPRMIKSVPAAGSQMDMKANLKSISKDEVKCLICGHGGMKVLKQHLAREHHMTPKDYKKQFKLPMSMPLVSKAYHEERRTFALSSGLGRKKVVVTQAHVLRKGRRPAGMQAAA